MAEIKEAELEQLFTLIYKLIGELRSVGEDAVANVYFREFLTLKGDKWQNY